MIQKGIIMNRTLTSIILSSVTLLTLATEPNTQRQSAYALMDSLKKPDLQTFKNTYEQMSTNFTTFQKITALELCQERITMIQPNTIKALVQAQKESEQMKRAASIAVGLPLGIGCISGLFGLAGLASPLYDTDWRETVYWSAGLPVALLMFYIYRMNADTVWYAPARLQHELEQLDLISEYIIKEIAAITPAYAPGYTNTGRR